MKLDATVDGRAAKIEIREGEFCYEREGAVCQGEFSVVPLVPGSYSIVIGGRSYEAIVSGGQVRVNGRAFSAEVFDPRSLRGRKTPGIGEGPQKIAATMPGKVIRVLVSEGDAVVAGQGLIVVEAMKMQNEMKSPTTGRVAGVKTKPGATVAAGEALMTIE
ncbi:MAG: biotin/lipoyl-containing protein [Bryobacteraceae bacterium]